MSANRISGTIILACVFALVGSAADKISAGKGTLYLGGRPNHIFMIDEATEKVTGDIHLKTGSAGRLSLSFDKKRFYAENIAYEDMEIVDIASRQVIDTFRLSEGNKKVRMFGFEPDPLDRFIILLTKSATKQADRFEVGTALSSGSVHDSDRGR